MSHWKKHIGLLQPLAAAVQRLAGTARGLPSAWEGLTAKGKCWSPSACGVDTGPWTLGDAVMLMRPRSTKLLRRPGRSSVEKPFPRKGAEMTAILWFFCAWEPAGGETPAWLSFRERQEPAGMSSAGLGRLCVLPPEMERRRCGEGRRGLPTRVCWAQPTSCCIPAQRPAFLPSSAFRSPLPLPDGSCEADEDVSLPPCLTPSPLPPIP